MTYSGVLISDGAPQTDGHRVSWSNLTPEVTRYSSCWIGRTEYVDHIVNHHNTRLPAMSGQYHLMTLKDAVSYTRFLAEFTCDFQRFAVIVPDCGRPVVSAVLTPGSFKMLDDSDQSASLTL